MTKLLIVGEESLHRHFRVVEQTIAATAKAHKGIALDINWDTRPVVAGLVGNSCEPTHRARGGLTKVLPWIDLNLGLWAWLGYREEWAGAAPLPRNVAAFSFRSLSITVHFGYRSRIHKPQMFRMEWSGWAQWNGRDGAPAFQAGNAAHPHWQFDALESLQRDEAAENARLNLAILKAEQEGIEPKEFVPASISDDDQADILNSQKLSRIHFPSGAHWWRSAATHDHAHAPSDIDDIQHWLRRSLEYLAEELSRLN